MNESTEVRCTVYKDEDPELYDFITSLPTSRYRKRAALIRLMLAGLHGTPSVPPAMVPALPAAELAAVPKKDRPEPDSSAEQTAVVIDAGDLFEVFGKKGG